MLSPELNGDLVLWMEAEVDSRGWISGRRA
jgi:hypothetical protein